MAKLTLSKKEILIQTVAGFEGRYDVYSDGRIYSHRRNGRFLSAGQDGHGYLKVGLFRPDGSVRTRTVHRLVAEAFISNIDGKAHVNHKNGIKTDNRVENLEWVTQAENVRHAISTGLNCLFGEGHGMTLVSEEDVLLIRASSMSVGELALKYGLTKSGVRQILSGRTWRHLPVGDWRPQQVRIMSDSDKKEAIRLRAQGMSGCRISKQLGFAASTVNCFLSGRSHKGK